jgi:uncharacterized membrane protein YqjE
MSLADGARRFAASLVLTGRQRLEMAALDVEEELLRAGLALAAIVAAVALGTLALMAIAAAIVIALWPWSPIGALVVLALLFGGGAACAVMYVVRSYREKPPFMGGTLEELRRDAQALQETRA